MVVTHDVSTEVGKMNFKVTAHHSRQKVHKVTAALFDFLRHEMILFTRSERHCSFDAEKRGYLWHCPD